MLRKNISFLLFAVVSVALLNCQTALSSTYWIKCNDDGNLLAKNHVREITGNSSETIENDCKLKNGEKFNDSIISENGLSTLSCNDFVIVVDVNGNGTVIGGGVYPNNAITTLTASANSNYHFVSWNDGDTSNPRTINVIGNETYTGIFEPDSYVIMVDSCVGGIVSGGGNYTYNTVIRLTATANDYYYFVKWSDGNTSNPRTVIVKENATYTAIFEPENYIITVMLVVMALAVGAIIILTIRIKH